MTNRDDAGLEADVVAEVLDELQDGVQVLSPEWRYLYVNEVVARQGRRSRRELLGKTMMECYPGIDQTPMFSVLQRCMRDRVSETMENEFTHDDGSRTWFELRIRPCRLGLVVVSLDISERKAVETRMKEAYARALRELVTPVIRLHAGVLLVPLIGSLDDERMGAVAESVLERVEREAAKIVIFDVAGVPTMDTLVAHYLMQTTAMIRLLGARVIVTGLAAAAARTIVQLGADMSTVETRSHLAEGIELALAHLGRFIAAPMR